MQQNAFADIDSYSDHGRQLQLLTIILDYDKLCRAALQKGAGAQDLFTIGAREAIGRAKYVEADGYAKAYTDIAAEMEQEIDTLIEKAGAEE